MFAFSFSGAKRWVSIVLGGALIAGSAFAQGVPISPIFDKKVQTLEASSRPAWDPAPGGLASLSVARPSPHPYSTLEYALLPEFGGEKVTEDFIVETFGEDSGWSHCYSAEGLVLDDCLQFMAHEPPSIITRVVAPVKCVSRATRSESNDSPDCFRGYRVVFLNNVLFDGQEYDWRRSEVVTTFMITKEFYDESGYPTILSEERLTTVYSRGFQEVTSEVFDEDGELVHFSNWGAAVSSDYSHLDYDCEAATEMARDQFTQEYCSGWFAPSWCSAIRTQNSTGPATNRINSVARANRQSAEAFNDGFSVGKFTDWSSGPELASNVAKYRNAKRATSNVSSAMRALGARKGLTSACRIVNEEMHNIEVLEEEVKIDLEAGGQCHKKTQVVETECSSTKNGGDETNSGSDPDKSSDGNDETTDDDVDCTIEVTGTRSKCHVLVAFCSAIP